ncbi:MAG TPA: hypothetical protein VNB94_03145 [Mycobacteriales bacterium]|nr:hypothetical protein [Mycobacteriales bacterium]
MAVPAYELNTNPQGTKLVLTTHGRGVWALDLTAAAVARPVPAPPPAAAPQPRPRAPRAPLPATGSPAWLVAAPLFAVAVLALRRSRRTGSSATD